MELILTAKVIKADEAKAIGLVSEVYPAEELMDKALELANAICANAQIAVQESKRCIRMGCLLYTSWPPAWSRAPTTRST